MSARPIATTTISFGLVSIPAKLYSTAESSARISFNWLNKATGKRVKQQYVDPSNQDVVPRSEMIKGYEFAKEQYVTFEPEELKAIEAQSTNTIEITEFVPAAEVDRMYYDRGYFLGPDKGGGKAYRLLSAALTDTGRVAIGKYAARGRTRLVMIRPYEDGLLLEQLYYPAELRAFAEVGVEDGEVEDSELELAKQLIKLKAVEEFDGSKYVDEVREQVQELIQKKIDGEQITVSAEVEPETKIIDLMEALKASLAGDGEAGGERKPPARAEKKGGAGQSKKSAAG